MSDTIPQAYIDSFEANVRHLSQQRMSRLLPFVDMSTDTGRSHRWDRVAASSAALKGSRASDPANGRLVPTPNNNSAVDGRLSIAQTWDLGETSEMEDPSQMLWDPNSALTKAVAMGMNRAYDQVIIEAAVGDARDQDGGVVAFDTNMNIGDGSTPLTYDAITQVIEMHLDADTDPDTPKVMVIGPTQMRKLLQLTEATSSDYVNVKTLATNGYVNDWMGHTWVVSTLLQAPAAGEIYCFSMTYDAVGLHVPQAITTKVGQDPSVSFAWRIYCASTLGAIRVEDQKLVRLHLADTV
jgi:hypothetical protein